MITALDLVLAQSAGVDGGGKLVDGRSEWIFGKGKLEWEMVESYDSIKNCFKWGVGVGEKGYSREIK